MTSPSSTGYRPDRFARAVRLVLSGSVERLGNGQYRVAGNTEPEYFVDLTAETPCYCRDMEMRGRQIGGHCKHHLAARIAGLDPSLVQILADRIEREEQQAAEAKSKRRSARRTPAETEGE